MPRRVPPHERDDVDLVIEQWARERPDLDRSPLAVVARLSKLGRKLEVEFGRGLGEFGLTEGEFDVLCALRRIGAPYRLKPSQIADTVLISASGLTKRLDSLERAGIVERQPTPDDRRSTLIALTPQGKRIVDRALTAHLDDEERVLAPLDADERSELAHLLSKLIGRGQSPAGSSPPTP